MSLLRRWISLGLLLSAPVLLAQTTAPAAAPTATPRHKAPQTQPPLVLPALPSGPLTQLPMDQIPPTPAKVTYQNGLLTISADNSTLSEILRDVRKLTGASIEIPQGAASNERVVTHLGPGAPRDVLAGLLNGCSFNYVMVGSSTDPTAVSSVMLTVKPSSAGEAQTAANVYQNNQAPPNRFPQPIPFNQQLIAQQPGNGQPPNAQPSNAPPVTADADDSKDEDETADETADDQAQPQPGQPGQPNMTGANAQDPQQQSDPNQPNAGPRTPEQILEMLRHPQPGSPVIPQQPPQQ
jgi:hypothetical protein